MDCGWINGPGPLFGLTRILELRPLLLKIRGILHGSQILRHRGLFFLQLGTVEDRCELSPRFRNFGLYGRIGL